MSGDDHCVLKPFGFTVVEVLVVIALIALIGGIGGGLYKGSYKALLVKRAARNFYLAAKYARMLAIERQQPCKIVLDSKENRYALVVDEFSEETQQVEQYEVRDFYFKPVELGGDIEFEMIQITSYYGEEDYQGFNPSLIFLSDGTSQAAVIQIGDGQTHYTAKIYPATGRVKMHYGQADELEAQIVDLDRIERY